MSAYWPGVQAIAPVTARGAPDDRRIRAMVNDHLAFTWRCLRRLGLPAEVADDAAQRVFLVASERLGEIRPGSERAFLFQTAVRVAFSEKRGFARRREVLEDEFTLADPSPGVDERLDRERARRMLDEVVEEMEIELRTVFVLFELEELGTAEIADLLSIPRGTVASRLRRAREEFDAAIARRRAKTTHMQIARRR